MGFKKEENFGGHSAEERARWDKATKKAAPSTWHAVEQIKKDAFQGASEAFTRRFEEHEDLIDEGRAHRAEQSARSANTALYVGPGQIRIPKGWPSLMEWVKGAPLPPDDGKDLEY